MKLYFDCGGLLYLYSQYALYFYWLIYEITAHKIKYKHTLFIVFDIITVIKIVLAVDHYLGVNWILLKRRYKLDGLSSSTDLLYCNIAHIRSMRVIVE